jgi:hypothetical protein
MAPSLWDTPEWLAGTLALPEQQAALIAPDAMPDGVPALAAPDELEVVACPHPFSLDRVYLALPAGLTLTELVALAGVPAWADARVLILHGDLLYGPIPRAEWDRLRPQPGRRVVIRAVPRGGGTGGDSNKTLRTVLQLVVAIAASVLSGAIGGAAGAFVGMAVNFGLQYALSQLLPVPAPRLGMLAGLAGAGTARAGQAYSITGSLNVANPYGAIPKIYGTHRMFPPVHR